MRFVTLLLLLLGCALPVNNFAAQVDQIRMMDRKPGDTRWDYPIALLVAALQATKEDFGPWTLAATAPSMSRNRALQMLKEGKLINLHIAPTRNEWEEQVLPIRIPIRKGLLGYRLFLIHKENQQKFAAIESLEELQQLSTGLHRQWSTTKALRALDFKVVEGSSYQGLFTMLHARRFDYFIRGVNEIFEEFALHRQSLPNLLIEPTKALYLPLPTYFFVSPKQPRLAERLQAGLERLLADGSLDRLFEQYHGDHIRQARLQERQIFVLENPLLSAETPLADERLWLNLNLAHEKTPAGESR